VDGFEFALDVAVASVDVVVDDDVFADAVLQLGVYLC